MNWLILAAACLCGEAPERANDFFWENDCVGFRAYGPGDVHKWSGIDVFNKSCAENIVVHWLRHSRTNAAYKGWHKNHGFGMDNYAVGPGRGVGGVALRKDGRWLPDYGNWYRYRVLTNGDERCAFELDYRLPIGGTMTLGISLPRGSSFFTETVSFSSDTPLAGVEVGIGLDLNAQRLHAGDVFVDERKGVVSLFENPHLGKDGKPLPGEEGATMTALIGVRHVAATVDEPNGAKMLMTKPLAASDANGKPVLEVLAGADWTLAGRHATAAAWHETVRAAAAKAAAPADDGLVRVTVETSLGDIELELDAQKAPASVANFVAYAKAGHYADTIFHRVIGGFMIQGGGFTADMRQKETRPPIRNEAANGLKNARGTIAMARTMDVDSATSQFFINLVDNAFLDYRSPDPRGFGYAVFGRVTKGMDVVDRIAKVPTGDSWPHQNVPLEPVTIKRVLVKE